MKPIQLFFATASLAHFGCGVALAHDPVFSPGPHVLYKAGLEVHVGAHRKKAGQEKEIELGLELAYGLTSDWVAGVELQYAKVEDGADNGIGDMRLFSKYRF